MGDDALGEEMCFASVQLIERPREPQNLSVTEGRRGKWPSLSVLTAGAVKLKRITYPSGCALRVHLMSFMDVSKYELPTSKQTTPLSWTEGNIPLKNAGITQEQHE